MRIATWNVNSLKARLEKVSWWLDRARPDVLLMQETKLADAAAPVAEFRAAGYELAHHGEGQWDGVAIASRVGIADVVTNFGEPLRPARTPDVGDDEPLAEARMMAATCGDVRVVSLYAPNGRSVGSTFYEAKLLWYERLARWLALAESRFRLHLLPGHPIHQRLIRFVLVVNPHKGECHACRNELLSRNAAGGVWEIRREVGGRRGRGCRRD